MQTVGATSETEPTAKSATQHVELAPQTTKDAETDIETVALVVDAPKADFKLTPIILDQVRLDEVLIDMKYTGICHTDIVLQQGLLPMVEFPAIFGHEGAGTIRALGSAVRDTSVQVGECRPPLIQHLRHLQCLHIRPSSLLPHTPRSQPQCPISKFEDALADIKSGKVIKPVIAWE